MKTLVTGFGPFGDVVNNPSARLAAHLAEIGAPGHEFTIRILPVSFERSAAEIEGLLLDGQFDLALLLGVAGKESEIRIETCGRNRDEARLPDCDGIESTGLIWESGPDVLITTVDPNLLHERVSAAGVPARLSEDAGGYVCNRVYYSALAALERHSLATRCVFIHVPPDAATFHEPPDYVGMDFERQVLAIRAILAALS